MDDGIREVSGVKDVRSDELDIPVLVAIDEQFARRFVTIRRLRYDVVLTPDQARRLALQLNRLARRVEARASLA